MKAGAKRKSIRFSKQHTRISNAEHWNHEDDNDEDEDLISSSTDDTLWKVLSWLQVCMIILYAFTCTYGEGADPKKPDTGDLDSLYGMFQNVHVIVFVGFALLMAFLRKYGYGAMAFTLLIDLGRLNGGLYALATCTTPLSAIGAAFQYLRVL